MACAVVAVEPVTGHDVDGALVQHAAYAHVGVLGRDGAEYGVPHGQLAAPHRALQQRVLPILVSVERKQQKEF